MKKFGFVVFVIILNLFVSSSSFSSATEELEGTLEIIMATDISQKTCEAVYSINVNGKRTQFSLPARVPPLSPGQKIKISGRWEEGGDGINNFHCRKVESVSVAPTAKKAVSVSGKAKYLPDQNNVLGAQRTLVALIHFPNHDTPEWGKEEAENKVFSSEPMDEWPFYTNDHSDNAYWKECSGDKMWLEGKCLDGWKDMPYPATDYGYGGNDELDFFGELRIDAINAIDPYIDFTQYDRLIFIRSGKGWGYDFSTLGKWKIETNDGKVNLSVCFVTEIDTDLNRYIISHELGHGFGLVHADSIIASTGVIYTYGDIWENRGGLFAQLDGLHKYMLGWLDLSQIEIIYSDGEYWLDQREISSNGTKLLVIYLGYDDNNRLPILYYLEYFKELGEFDSQIFFDFEPDSKKDAVLLRKYKQEAGNYTGTYDSLVFIEIEDPNNPSSETIPKDLESQEFCDSDYENLESFGVCIQVLEKTETEDKSKSQAKVKITLTSDYSFPTPIPTPTPTPCKPAIVSISSGGSMNIKKKTSGKVTVEVTSASGCAVEGEMVEAIVTSASGQKRIAVSPSSGNTDENGQVVFTITAGKKTGKAVVAFEAGNLKTFLYVKVSK